MKFILYLLFASIIYNHTKAQPAPGSYTKDTALNKFVGTWIYQSDTDQVIIVLQKQKIYFQPPLNCYADALVGWHSYTKNGQNIESSLSHQNTPYDKYATILDYSHSPNPESLNLSFDDISKNKGGRLTITRLSGNKLQWSLHEREIMLSLPGKPFVTGFTLPQNMILKKITK
ncbi:MAG: DUF6705 family protein [Chitinophagaceae bacterium]